MKLRTDFVTNSSSVSYIVTMNLNIVNCFLDNFREFKNMKGTIRIAEALKNYLCSLMTMMEVLSQKKCWK